MHIDIPFATHPSAYTCNRITHLIIHYYFRASYRLTQCAVSFCRQTERASFRYSGSLNWIIKCGSFQVSFSFRSVLRRTTTLIKHQRRNITRFHFTRTRAPAIPRITTIEQSHLFELKAKKKLEARIRICESFRVSLRDEFSLQHHWLTEWSAVWMGAVCEILKLACKRTGENQLILRAINAHYKSLWPLFGVAPHSAVIQLLQRKTHNSRLCAREWMM